METPRDKELIEKLEAVMRATGFQADLEKTSKQVMELITISLSQTHSPSLSSIMLLMSAGYLMNIGNSFVQPGVLARHRTDEELKAIIQRLGPLDVEMLISMLGVMMWQCYKEYTEASHG